MAEMMAAPPGSMDSNMNKWHGIIYEDFLDLWPSCACAVVFFLLLLWDVCKAFKRRALWIPGQALVLSALTIQMLSLISYSDISYTGDENNAEAATLLTRHQPLFDCARLTMCVFIGYLLPGMVCLNWTGVWSDIGGLILSVMLHMAFEVYSVWKYYGKYSKWFFVSTITLFTASVVLLLILSCAVLAGKSIHNILSQNIPSALSCCCNSGKRDCNSIEDHVLKCWIVVRASQPDYIMARSVFTSLAGLVVTISVVIVAIKWSRIQLPPTYDIAHTSAFFIQFAFILLGWMVIAFRWLTAVILFPKLQVNFLLRFEDFWTRSIVEVKDDLHAYCTGRLYRKKIIGQGKLGPSYMVTLITALRLHHFLLPMRFWLQLLMVSLGKVCWCISEIVIGIMIRPFKPGPPESDEFDKYKEALDIIRMPYEDAYSLWIANKWGFKKTENHMKQGIKMGENSTAELIELRRHKTGTGEAATSSHESELELEQRYYKLRKKSWKMKAVSLIDCMIYFYNCNTNSHDVINVDNGEALIINDAIKACSQAWDFMDFVDSSDPEADIVSLAADKEFDKIENIWKKRSNKVLQGKIKGLKETIGKKPAATWDNEHQAQDSTDWMRLAVQINTDKTSRTHEANLVDSANAIQELRGLLANLIHVDCMKNELDKAVIKNCSKWAKYGMEAEIYRAAFIVGKAKGLRGKFAEPKERGAQCV